MNARGSVKRSILFYAPFFGAIAAMWTAIVLQPVTGGSFNLVGLIIVTPAFLLVGWHFLSLVRDVRAPLKTYEGEVLKTWSRFDLPFGRSHYLLAGGSVFKLPVAIWAQIQAGDRVIVTYLPYTATVESIDFARAATPATPVP